jgi:hypothetical protein
MKRAVAILFAAAALSGCTSPEATRQRGGGPGADVGNRPAQVKMHEGSRQYYKTPVRIGTEAPPLAPSEQARTLSLPGRTSGDGSGTGGQP